MTTPPFPYPTGTHITRALDLHGGDVDRATVYLCRCAGINHPAARTLIRRRVSAWREHPSHDRT